MMVSRSWRIRETSGKGIAEPVEVEQLPSSLHRWMEFLNAKYALNKGIIYNAIQELSERVQLQWVTCWGFREMSKSTAAI